MDGMVSISTGIWHTCGVTGEGSLLCWGRKYEASGTPIVGRMFTDVGSGDRFSCALSSDGRAFCWGLSQADRQTQPLTEDRYDSISVGGFHTCGLKQDGTPVCWGFRWSPGAATPGYSIPSRRGQ